MPKVFLQPSIKLLETFLKSGFAMSRFPGLQIVCTDEVFLTDPNYWDVIFLNDSAEVAWRIARLKGRTRNIEEAPLRLGLNCLWAHLDTPRFAFVQAEFQALRNLKVLPSASNLCRFEFGQNGR
jgi:hypothetical protein